MAAAPIYLEPAPPSAQVRAAEAALALMEPPLTVNGFQYATASDAALARRQEAEYRVREAERMARLVHPTPAELDDVRENHAALDAAADINRLARELRVACASARADDGGFSARGRRGRDDSKHGPGRGPALASACAPNALRRA